MLLLTHSYWPEHSPPQRRWTYFVKMFREHGWDVEVIAPRPHEASQSALNSGYELDLKSWNELGPSGEIIKRVPSIRLGKTRLGKLVDQSLSAVFTVPRSLLTKRPDVIVTTVPSLPIGLAGYVISKLLRVPLTLDMRDAWPDLARDARIVKGNAKSLIERLLLRVQADADLVITVTEGFARTLRNRGVRHVITVSNGVDTSRIRGNTPVKGPPCPLNAVYLGNHGESQNLSTLIRAAALVGDRVKLTMVGNGIEKPKLKKLAKSLRVNVEFRDPVTTSAQVQEIYAMADTCIVSLRDDWKSFDNTVPSKLYEVLTINRHITGIVRGEAEQILRTVGVGDIVPSSSVHVANLWLDLIRNSHKLQVTQSGRRWVQDHAELSILGERLVKEITDRFTNLDER